MTSGLDDASALSESGDDARLALSPSQRPRRHDMQLLRNAMALSPFTLAI
jgi:hypothetical protein